MVIEMTEPRILSTSSLPTALRSWTLFEKKNLRRPNYETLNEIVYIMADKHQIVKNVEVMNELNIGSDHRMVRCRVKIDTKRERRHLFHHTPEPLRESPFYVEEFTIKLQNRNAALEEEDGNINETTVNNPKNVVKPLVATAKEFATPRKIAKKCSRETLDLTEKRKNLQTPTSAWEKVEAAELNKTIKTKQRQDFRKHRTELIQEVIKQGKGFKMAREKPSSRKVQFTEVWEEDGSLTIDRGRIYNRAQKFYEKLNSSDPRSWTFRPGGETWVGRLLAVELAIKQSKKGKAPELDNITIDLIEATGETIYTKLAALFNEYLIRESKVPGV